MNPLTLQKRLCLSDPLEGWERSLVELQETITAASINTDAALRWLNFDMARPEEVLQALKNLRVDIGRAADAVRWLVENTHSCDEYPKGGLR